VYNTRPDHIHQTEAKKTKFEMAEYDHEFFDRMMAMGDVELASYLHSLTKAERDAIVAAMIRALSERIVKVHIDDIQMGLNF
jgi:hypothetical protein